ncbi:hypothetical protein NL676_013107 [Syzygium grande]|nr:hypothetical protein NL676_013107 [Syzygium grande]
MARASPRRDPWRPPAQTRSPCRGQQWLGDRRQRGCHGLARARPDPGGSVSPKMPPRPDPTVNLALGPTALWRLPCHGDPGEAVSGGRPRLAQGTPLPGDGPALTRATGASWVSPEPQRPPSEAAFGTGEGRPRLTQACLA